MRGGRGLLKGRLRGRCVLSDLRMLSTRAGTSLLERGGGASTLRCC